MKLRTLTHEENTRSKEEILAMREKMEAKNRQNQKIAIITIASALLGIIGFVYYFVS